MRASSAAIVLALLASPVLAQELAGRATVVDGDTIMIEGQPKRIRLFGMDAPESTQTCEDEQDKRFFCGMKSAGELASIVGRNGRVVCQQMDTDRYGRVVAICRLGGLDLAAEMIRRGWALDFARYSKGRYEAEEEAARNAGAGMWAGDFEEPWEWRAKRRNRPD